MSDLHTVPEFTAAAEAGERWTDELVGEATGYECRTREDGTCVVYYCGVEQAARERHPHLATCRPDEREFWPLFGEVITALLATGANLDIYLVPHVDPVVEWETPAEKLSAVTASTLLLTACIALLLAKGKLKED